MWWIILVLSPCTCRFINPESLAGQSLIGRTAVHNDLRFGKIGARALPCDSRSRCQMIPSSDRLAGRTRIPGCFRLRHRKRQTRRPSTPHAKEFEKIPRFWVWLRFPSCNHSLWSSTALRRGRGPIARHGELLVRYSYLRRFSHQRGPSAK